MLVYFPPATLGQDRPVGVYQTVKALARLASDIRKLPKAPKEAVITTLIISMDDPKMHDLLKTQHKGIIDAIRSGSIETLFPAGDITHTNLPAQAATPQSQPAALALEWLNSDAVYSQDSMVMRFSVTQAGKAIPGAQLISRLTVASDAPIYSQAVTNAEGIAEMKIFLEESALADAAVLVQATHEGRHATRKFRLHRTA